MQDYGLSRCLGTDGPDGDIPVDDVLSAVAELIGERRQ